MNSNIVYKSNFYLTDDKHFLEALNYYSLHIINNSYIRSFYDT